MLNRNWSTTGSLDQPSGAIPAAAALGLGRHFGNLQVRPKLIVLHNLFFLILAIAVYFTLIPALDRRVAQAKSLEAHSISETFRGELTEIPARWRETYDLQEGSASLLHGSPEALRWLEDHPGEIWADPRHPENLYRAGNQQGLFRRVTLPNKIYDEIITRAKWALFFVLAAVYLSAVLLLELVIMPRYVYIPLRLMLDADEATQRGDRHRELIDQDMILADEIGTIMRSRNQTVAELRRQEDELAQALSRLEAQDRLASLGLLSASVAHEMNTPLAVLHGSIEKLLETVQENHAQERLRRMLRVTERLRTISEGLVDFARVRRPAVDTVILKPLLEEAWGLVCIDEKSASVDFHLDVDDDVAVCGSADRLLQVFVNLLRNSLVAVQTEGHIRVWCNRYRQDKKCWVTTAVEDNGPGIPPDVLPNIFDAFVSSRLDAKGTGLGLTVAAGIVQQHGGTIHAGNCPSGGARLQVTLPGATMEGSVSG